MYVALISAVTLLVTAIGSSSSPLSDSDFQQLMEVAVAAASAPSEIQPHTTTIWVARQLEPAFSATTAWIATWEAAGKGVTRPRTGDVGADNSMTAAMSPNAVAHQTTMPALPAKY